MKAKPWSSPSTTACALDLLSELDWTTARVADVGAGRGWFSRVLSEHLRERHRLDPRGRVLPCDVDPRSFEYDGIECAPTGADGKLPYADASLDAAVSIEVVEHVEDPFAFLRELARVVKPGGIVVVSTPNVLAMTSRIRTLLWGFPELFDPLPLAGGDPRRLSGHIHPLPPYYLALAALRAGLVGPTLHADRRKRSAAAWTIALSPALLAAGAFHRARLRRKHPDVLDENRSLLADISSWDLLTARSVVLRARKPARASPA